MCATLTSIINRSDLKQVSEFSSAGGQVMGVELNFPEIRNLPIAQGRYLNEQDMAAAQTGGRAGAEDGESSVSGASFAGGVYYAEWVSVSGDRRREEGRARKQRWG